MHKISFDDMVNQFTEFNFHDAAIYSVHYNYEDEFLDLSIIHWRSASVEWRQVEVKSNLRFEKIKNIRVGNVHELFFLKRQINSFEKITEEDACYYELMGIKGWTLKFEAEELYYSEEILSEEDY